MANETQIGQLVLNLKVKTEELEKGLETAKKKLQEIEEQNKNLKNSNKDLDASFIAMSASIVASLVKIKNAIDDCINVYNDYNSANVGLKSILDGQGKDFQEAQEFIEEYISDGLIPLSDATTAYKNLALRGYNSEQIKQTMINLKDAAAFGRQSTLEYGYAIRSATEGLKNFNPVLVDNAGVQKNMSVMYDEYAAKIGTTAAKLTDEQKILAEVNGIMEETKNQTGDAAKYAETFSGQQAQLNAEILQTKNAIGESLIPVMQVLNSLFGGIIKGIKDTAENNKSGTVAFITFSTTLLATTLIIIGLKKANEKLAISTTLATIKTKGFTATLKGMFATLAANPIGLVILAIASLTAGIVKLTYEHNENTEATERARAEQELYNDVMNKTAEVTDENIAEIKELTAEFENYRMAIINARNVVSEFNSSIDTGIDKAKKLFEVINAYTTISSVSSLLGLKYDIETMEDLENAINNCNDEQEKYNLQKELNNNIDVESARNKKKEAAQLVETAKEYQKLFDIYKKGEKGTEEYKNAVKTLSEAFPEAVSATGILDEEMQAFISNAANNAEISLMEAQNIIDEKIQGIQQTIQRCSPEIDLDGSFRASVAEKFGVPADEVIGKLQSLLTVLNILKGTSTENMGGVSNTTTTSTKSTGSSSYSNKALDNYKKEIAHKKALDQLSIQQEISMYEYALKRYAKTTDEKRELRETIYELNKELAQKEKDILDQQTEDYENYIQDQKNARGSAYDVTEQTSDYNKIIQMHKNYLNQIMKDERLSLEERKEIYRDELQTIRDYEQQKRDLRVEQIDNTVSQLTNAITKQLEEMQEKDKELIDKNIETVEKWKEARINAINEEYDARIEAIEKELDALDKAEQQKTRDEEDAEYEKKKKRLEELVAFEHDATTKANYQKELDKLISEYQGTLDKRTLEDKKEALNAQKDLLQQEQDDKTQAIEDEADKQKEVYDKQLEDLEEYYDEQIEKAQETAEKMLLNVEQNQDKILSLLKNYGDAYEITGQSLGEKLAQGINEGLTSKIENIIARIQNSIDAGIEAQISKMTSTLYKYEAGTSKPQTTSINITQQNYIEQNPEMPSETYRKLNNVSEKLAEQLAGI